MLPLRRHAVLSREGIQGIEYNRPKIDITKTHGTQQDFLRSILARYTKAALSKSRLISRRICLMLGEEHFFEERGTPDSKLPNTTKPIIVQLYEKRMGIINFPHGIEGKLTCIGDDSKQKKKFSWDSFILDGKVFPSSQTNKGPLQLIVEPVLKEQEAMLRRVEIPNDLQVFYFVDLRNGEQ